MKKWIISGCITVPVYEIVYEVVEAESEDEAFSIFKAKTEKERGSDVDYDSVIVDEK